MSSQLLTPKDLCERWKIANNTLRKWRVSGYGPAYIKLGDYRNAEVRYRLEDVEEFEKYNRFVTSK
ncbi:pyocin activator protein prtN [Caudoviricetes sp.]|nr:pyocin activator protein prtN [Caudoviricetes sp.]